jgi:hypothetical protein
MLLSHLHYRYGCLATKQRGNGLPYALKLMWSASNHQTPRTEGNRERKVFHIHITDFE